MGWGSRIRDPRTGKNLFRIPDPGVKKAPDPGSATLAYTVSSKRGHSLSLPPPGIESGSPASQAGTLPKELSRQLIL
jgi:hypothetical protein